MLAVTCFELGKWPVVMGTSFIVSFSCSTNLTASSFSMRDDMIANSSPPYLAKVSEEPAIKKDKVFAICFRQLSPAIWPYASLNSLKRSTSIINNDRTVPVALHVFHLVLKASSKAKRFKTPVKPSI